MRINITLYEIFPVLIFFILLVFFITVIKIDFREFKSLFERKRIKRIRKLTKEEMILQQLKRDLKEVDYEKKGFISFVENKLYFIRSPYGFNEFLLGSIILGLFTFAAAYFLFQFWYMAVIAFILGISFPLMIIMNVESKIIDKSNQHCKKFITLTRETSIGSNNALSAIKATIKNLKDPFKTLVKDIVVSADNGTMPIEAGFHKLAVEMKNDYLLLFSIALKKQKETGKNFRETLSNVHTIIANDERIKSKNRRDTKYGVASFIFLVCFYFIELLIIRFGFPTSYKIMIIHPIGRTVLYLSSMFVMINLLLVIWIYKR